MLYLPCRASSCQSFTLLIAVSLYTVCSSDARLLVIISLFLLKACKQHTNAKQYRLEFDKVLKFGFSSFFQAFSLVGDGMFT